MTGLLLRLPLQQLAVRRHLALLPVRQTLAALGVAVLPGRGAGRLTTLQRVHPTTLTTLRSVRTPIKTVMTPLMNSLPLLTWRLLTRAPRTMLALLLSWLPCSRKMSSSRTWSWSPRC